MTDAEKKFLKLKADVFKALGHPTRLWIVEKLKDGETCVCEFVNATDYDFSTISSHLAVLQKAGIVSSEKRGREIYYSLKIPCLFKFINCLEEAIKKQLVENIQMLKTL